MFTVTKDLMIPATITGSWPRPRWFDVSLWGKPLDTCMLDVRFREKFQDALAVVVNEQQRAGLDILSNGDFHADEDLGGRSWVHYVMQRWPGLEGDYMHGKDSWLPWRIFPTGTLLHEIYTGWRWPRVTGEIEYRPLDYDKIWRMTQALAVKPVRFGTCSAQMVGSYLEVHTPHYKDNREVVWAVAEAMNQELLKLRDAGCKCIQIEEPCLHFLANTFGKNDERVKFMLDAYNREVQGLDDVEIWIHTCWGNPNMQRVMENTSYADAIELYMEQCRGDVWTVEMKDRNQRDIELFDRYKRDGGKKVAVGVVSHRSLQADRPEEVALEIRKALQYIPPERLIVSSDCGFGRQGCNREIAFYKATAIAQGANLVRKELGLPTTYIPAADPCLQTDIVPAL